MGLKVDYIIKRPRGKMTYRILDIIYIDGVKFFNLKNMINGKVYHTRAEDNWQYYGRVYDTIEPQKTFPKFNFKQ